MSDQPDKPFLQIVVCAAGVAVDVGRLITAAQERHWDVGVIATPQGLGFLDAEAVEVQTGRPIRSAWRSPGSRARLGLRMRSRSPRRPSTRSTSGRRGSLTISRWASCAKRPPWTFRSLCCRT